MSNAYRDSNSVPTMIGVLDTNGTTTTRIQANASTHFLSISDGTTGSDYGQDGATRDENNIPVLIAASSSDGRTPVPLYVNSSNQLLIQST